MIEVNQHPEEGTRTPENSCHWVAKCMIGGKAYTARSRRGAPHELARLLVGSGVPDQPLIVRSRGLAGHLAYRSLHAMAGFTIEENSGTSPRRAKWREADPDIWAGKGGGEAQKGGGSPADVNQALLPSTLPKIASAPTRNPR